jgi:hypothetical protein
MLMTTVLLLGISYAALTDPGGSCAATGDGDKILRFCPSLRVVERMSQGMHPSAACAQVATTCIRSHSVVLPPFPHSATHLLTLSRSSVI